MLNEVVESVRRNMADRGVMNRRRRIGTAGDEIRRGERAVPAKDRRDGNYGMLSQVSATSNLTDNHYPI